MKPSGNTNIKLNTIHIHVHVQCILAQVHCTQLYVLNTHVSDLTIHVFKNNNVVHVHCSYLRNDECEIKTHTHVQVYILLM